MTAVEAQFRSDEAKRQALEAVTQDDCRRLMDEATRWANIAWTMQALPPEFRKDKLGSFLWL